MSPLAEEAIQKWDNIEEDEPNVEEIKIYKGEDMKMKIRKMVSLALASIMVIAPTTQALAATIYVGEVGFDLNKIANDDEYKVNYMEYMAINLNGGIYFDFDDDGEVIDLDAFIRSGLDVSKLKEYEAANGVKHTGEIWDGVGKPGASDDGLEVISITSREVELGTPVALLELPTETIITLDDGTEKFVDISWNTENYNKDVAGEYTIIGNLTAEAGDTYLMQKKKLA